MYYFSTEELIIIAIINTPKNRFSRMALYIPIAETLYSPRGFIHDPQFSDMFSKLSDRDIELIFNGFIKYLAKTMRTMLKKSIEFQYYKGRWAPLSPAYLKFKQAHGLSENIWEATGRLHDSISYRKSGDKYIIGIRPNATYENGTSVQYVAVCMEYGTENMPARPLFRPVTNFIKRNIRLYWINYLSNPTAYLTQRVVNKLKGV